MAVVTTTTIAVVGSTAATAASNVAAASSNVSNVPIPGLPEDPLRRHAALQELWRSAQRQPPVYTLVAIDPLAALIEHWAQRLDGRTSDLETLIGATPQSPMPHYLLVDAALPEPAVHWYLGLLAGLAGSRVQPITMTEKGIVTAISSLPTGPELPGTLDVALRSRDYVPLPDVTPGQDSAPPKNPF